MSRRPRAEGGPSSPGDSAEDYEPEEKSKRPKGEGISTKRCTTTVHQLVFLEFDGDCSPRLTGHTVAGGDLVTGKLVTPSWPSVY